MARYFTRAEAEALLPQISVVLRDIQRECAAMQKSEEELGALEEHAKGNGHDLHGRTAKLQREMAEHAEALRMLAVELERFGCELKDPDSGLIDFLSLREGRAVYLCWRLGEGERIEYWHELRAGVAGRQQLEDS